MCMGAYTAGTDSGSPRFGTSDPHYVTGGAVPAPGKAAEDRD